MISLLLPDGQPLALAPGATLSLEQNNPLLSASDDNGSYALPFSIPRTPGTQRALNFPELLDNAAGSRREWEGVQAFDDGNWLVSGTLKLLRITPANYEFTMLFGTSALMSKLKTRKLKDFDFGGIRVLAEQAAIPEVPITSSIFYAPTRPALLPEIAEHMDALMQNPDASDYVFAPFSNNDAYNDYPDSFPRLPNCNQWLPPFADSPGRFFLHDGMFLGMSEGIFWPTSFPYFQPEFCRTCVPLVRVGYIVRTILQASGIAFEGDFFDEEMEQLVMVANAPLENSNMTLTPNGTKDVGQVNPAPAFRITFRLGDIMPDLTAAEFLRKLADEFYLDLSPSPTGSLRLRRTKPLIEMPPAIVLTRRATPGMELELNEGGGLATAYKTGDDRVAEARYREVDPAQRAADVATVATLPVQPEREHEVRLVLELNEFYQHDGKEWKFYSYNLPTPFLGGGDESSNKVEQGAELLLELTTHSGYGLLVPGGEIPDPPEPIEPLTPERLRVPAFGSRSYSPTHNLLTRSPSLRLAFWRGMQPYENPAHGNFPMLTTLSHTNLQGVELGQYSLRLDGPAGTVAQFGKNLLEVRANAEAVKWPVWLTVDQFAQLDTARQVEVDGVHFIVKKISLTYPIKRPALLELVPVRPKLTL